MPPLLMLSLGYCDKLLCPVPKEMNNESHVSAAKTDDVIEPAHTSWIYKLIIITQS